MRDADLIIKGSVCQSSFYDDGILTLADARKAGTKDCRFLASCNSIIDLVKQHPEQSINLCTLHN